MKRLNKTQISTIRKLTIAGNSVNKICKKLRLPKSVVYYWFRKERGVTFKQIKINENLEKEIGEIIGAFAGDGSFILDKNYKYKIRFYLSPDEIPYAKKIRKLLRDVYGKSGKMYIYENITIVEIFGKVIINHIHKFLTWENKKTYSVRLKGNINKLSLDFLRGFCRGLIDTEGWITKNNLMLSCVSDQLMNDLSNSLNILRIPHLKTSWKRKDENRHIALFFNKKNTIEFFKKIGSSNSKRVRMLPTGFEPVSQAVPST